jgi:uncharacterized protein (DUF736 family)
MSVTGQFTKTDDSFEGYIASESFDLDVIIVRNASKQSDVSPDYEVMTKSPRGRTIRIGGVWVRRSRADNDFLSLAAKISGQQINANLFPRTDDSTVFDLAEWKD